MGIGTTRWRDSIRGMCGYRNDSRPGPSGIAIEFAVECVCHLAGTLDWLCMVGFGLVFAEDWSPVRESNRALTWGQGAL